MSKDFIIVLAVIVLAVQFGMVMLGPINPARSAYRHQERFAALKAMEDNPTPATKAAFQNEMQLALHYQQHQQLVRGTRNFAILLFIEGAGVYFWIRYGKRKSA